jgi:Predicted transcriptional regulator
MKHAFDVQYPLAAYMLQGPLPISDVAAYMGCSYMTAKRRLKALGVVLRKAGKRRGGRGAPPTLYRRVK